MKYKKINSQLSILNFQFRGGFGIIEVIVAVAIFAIVAITGGINVLEAFSSNRLGDEYTEATFFAQEGVEAVRSIRNQAWSNLTPGTFGLNTPAFGTSWSFSGVLNTLDAKFTRSLTLESAQRDCTGNIASSGGVVDTDTMKATSNVVWNFTPARTNTISLATYLTRWKKPVLGGGMLAYADTSGADDVIRYKILDNTGSWGSEQTGPDLGVPSDRPTRSLKLYSSSTRNEKILITKHFASGAGDDQYIYAAVWNGTSWGNTLQLSSWEGIDRPYVRSFDGDYAFDGNFILVYEDNTTTPKYRIWNGSSWSAQSSVGDIGGNPEWVVLRSRPCSNEAMLAIFDDQQDTNTVLWNGSVWTGLTEHATEAPVADEEQVDFSWSKNSPTTGALIFNEANDNNPNLRAWNGSSWSAPSENVDIGASTRAMRLVDNPSADEFLGCSRDSANDINCLEGNLTPTWSTLTNGEVATGTDIGAQRSFDLAFEPRNTSLGLVVYSNGVSAIDRAIPKFRTFNPSTNSFSAEQLLSLLGIVAELEAVRLIPSQAGNEIMVLMAATDQDLWTVVWDGSSDTFYSSGGKSQTEQATSGSEDTDFWFDFAWDKH